MKEVCFVCHIEISQTTMAPTILLVQLESLPWEGCIDKVLECLDLQCKSYWILNNSVKENETKSKLISLEKLAELLVIWKAPQSVGFLGGDFATLDLRWVRYWILGHFHHRKLIKNFKYFFHNWALLLGSCSIWSRLIVAFTLGPVAQVAVEFMV